MSRSVFSKIIEREMKASIVFEDKNTLAFLDHNPLTKGHTLVIPKQEIDRLEDCPPELYKAIFDTVHRVSRHLLEKLRPKRIALVVHGLDVPHAHVHLVPLYTGHELQLATRLEPAPDHEALEGLARVLAMN